MKIAMQIWYDAWLKEHRENKTDLIYANPKDPSLEQVHFVRDQLSALVWQDVGYYDRPTEPEPRDDCRESAWVIGEHRSKSVRLPVYSIERPDLGLRLVMRSNFYDWKLSVISETPIDDPIFEYLFHTTPPVEPDYTGNELASCYFEGFPETLVFGYQAQNKRLWSAAMSRDSLYFTTFLIMKQLGVAKPRKWLTREEHRAQLDAESAAFKKYFEADKAKRKLKTEPGR